MAGPETPKQPETLRQKLTTELDQSPVFEHVAGDSGKYIRLSTGLKVMLLHSLRAAEVVEKDLDAQKGLKEDDPKRLSAEEIAKREAYLTEVDSWAVTIPHLLRITRGMQFHPEVQERMGTLSGLVHNQLKLNEDMEKNRLGIVSRSEFPEATLARLTIWELSYIATYEWLKANNPKPNEKVMKDPAMLKEHLQSMGILREQEKEHGVRVGKTEEGGKDLQQNVDILRAFEGAERVTQNYPGAEYVLDMPEVSMTVWKKLLLDGGPRERLRGSAQLKDSVSKFQLDFMEGTAFQTFREKVRSMVDRAKLENDVAKRTSLLKWILPVIGKDVQEKLVTDPAAFEQWFEKTMRNIEGGFNEIASTENKQTCRELYNALRDVQEGKAFDRVRLEQLLDAYTDIQVKNRSIMSKLQNWQTMENALLPGGRGPQTRAEQMIDQGTSSNGKSNVEWLRRLAPYGSFQTRGFFAPNGRFVFIAPENAPQQLGPLGHGKEILKGAVETVIASIVLQHFALRAAQLAGVGFLGEAAAIIVPPVVIAEGYLAVSEGVARHTEYEAQTETINVVMKDLQALQQGKDRTGQKIHPELAKQLAQQAGEKIFSSMFVILQIASKGSRLAPKESLLLEAHVYANQLLNAFGFPGYHTLPEKFALPKEDERAGFSPEVREYLLVHDEDNREHTHEELAQFKLYLERLNAAKKEGKPAEVKRLSAKERLLQEKSLPMIRPVASLRDVLKSQEFASQYAEFKRKAKRSDVLKTVGELPAMRGLLLERLQPIVAPSIAQRVGRQIGKEVFGTTPPKPENLLTADDKKLLRKSLDSKNVKDVLLALKYLEENPPSNDEIRDWYKDAGVSQTYSDEALGRAFGSPEKREAMFDYVIESWRVLEANAPLYPEK